MAMESPHFCIQEVHIQLVGFPASRTSFRGSNFLEGMLERSARWLGKVAAAWATTISTCASFIYMMIQSSQSYICGLCTD